MSRKTKDYIPLSRLKGISVYMQDDLYNMARMKLELNDARAKYEKSNSISRPTMNGLVSLFARFIDTCSPDLHRVLDTIERHKFPMNVPIELDERCPEGLKDRVIRVRSFTGGQKVTDTCEVKHSPPRDEPEITLNDTYHNRRGYGTRYVE